MGSWRDSPCGNVLVDTFGLERRYLCCRLMPVWFLEGRTRQCVGVHKGKRGPVPQDVGGEEKCLKSKEGRAMWAHGGPEDRATMYVSHLSQLSAS